MFEPQRREGTKLHKGFKVEYENMKVRRRQSQLYSIDDVIGIKFGYVLQYRPSPGGEG